MHELPDELRALIEDESREPMTFLDWVLLILLLGVAMMPWVLLWAIVTGRIGL
jgi:hypothetical protein